MSCRAVLISALLPIGTAACVAVHPGYSDMLDLDHAVARDQIAALEGAAFDTAYLRAAVRGSDDTIALYTHEARIGGPPVMNHFAFAGVPRLEMQKQVAETLVARQGR